MEDTAIVDMLWKRDETALSEMTKKYYGFCRSLALRLLGNTEDAEECVNDAYLKAWNGIPPDRPERLDLYLGRAVRSLSVDLIRKKHAEKRGGKKCGAEISLEELEEVVTDGSTPESAAESARLSEIMDAFLRSLPETERNVFMRRYWFSDSIEEIAERFGFTYSKVTSMLMRTRRKLSKKLKEEGEV